MQVKRWQDCKALFKTNEGCICMVGGYLMSVADELKTNREWAANYKMVMDRCKPKGGVK